MTQVRDHRPKRTPCAAVNKIRISLLRAWVGTAACALLTACGGHDDAVVSAGSIDPEATASADSAKASDWRRLATPADRGRLRSWRGAWVNALAQADVREVARERALFDPDHALDQPLPPPGAYRCRTFKLGARSGTGLSFVGYAWFACRIVQNAGGETITLSKLNGSQRPVGTVYPDTDARGVFLGTMQLGDETRSMSYGRDTNRDMAGVMERIGPKRWRLVLPYPRFESILDVVELVPAP